MSKLDYHLIVVSNQAGIPLGIFTIKQMLAFNKGIRRIVKDNGGRLDAFYFAPYLEQKDLPSGVDIHPSIKPNPGMLLEAAEDFDLDLNESYIIGDTSFDIIAGQRAGCKTILVLTGKAGKEEDAIPCKPDYVVADLLEAAILINKINVNEEIKNIDEAIKKIDKTVKQRSVRIAH